MYDLSSYLNPNTVVEIKKKCPIHNCHLIQPSRAFIKAFGNSIPKKTLLGFCPECLEQRKKDEDLQMQKELVDRNTRGFLKQASLVKNKGQYKHTFANFETGRGTKNEQSELIKVKSATFDIANKYVKQFNNEFNSLLYGNSGSGKTHLAMAILNYVSQKSEPAQKCIFIDLNVLIDKRLAFVDKSTSSGWDAEKTKKIIKMANLVVIDDLGAESPNRSASSFVQKTLNDIYDSNNRIITTTNLSLQQLRATYEQRIISRMLSGASNNMVDFSNIKDFRFRRTR